MFGIAILLSMVGIVKVEGFVSSVALIVLTGSLLHYQDMLMLNFILVIELTIFEEDSLMQYIQQKVWSLQY